MKATPIPAGVRAIVADRDDGCCVRCGQRAPVMSVHHRKNRSQGGRHTPDNLVTVCGDGVRGDHGWITEHPTDARREGFTVPSWADPATTPLLRFAALPCAAPVLLTGDGRVIPYHSEDPT